MDISESLRTLPAGFSPSPLQAANALGFVKAMRSCWRVCT